uniref:Uncharacterized protein n=1 Tax=Anguilla anguilla TaxID=7936 RepID=A0A0E9S0K0_ANGAN
MEKAFEYFRQPEAMQPNWRFLLQTAELRISVQNWHFLFVAPPQSCTTGETRLCSELSETANIVQAAEVQ